MAPSPATAPAVYVQPVPIRFAHCDPAGIVFYPQYFVLHQGVVEDWFTHGLGVNYAQLIGPRRVGLPTVSLQTEFTAVSRLGETVDYRLQLARLGQRSISLETQVQAQAPGGELRLQMRQVIVFTSLDTHQSIDIPADVRQAMLRWQAAGGGPAARPQSEAQAAAS